MNKVEELRQKLEKLENVILETEGMTPTVGVLISEIREEIEKPKKKEEL